MTKTYCLPLGPTLTLEIDLDIESSIGESRNLAKPGRKDFIFAVGEIFISNQGRRDLVSTKFNTGETLGFLARLASHLEAAAELPAPFAPFIELGPCRWFVHYWEKIGSETATIEEEALYDLLSSYCVLAEGNGCLSIYRRAQTTWLQVCALESTVSAPLCYEVRVDPKATVVLIESLRSQIKSAVTAVLTAH